MVFGFVFAPLWVPKCTPRGESELGVSNFWGVQDGAGVVLVLFFCLAVWDRFFNYLGPSWGRLGVLLGRFRVLLGLSWFSWGRMATKWKPVPSSLLRFCVLLGLCGFGLGLCRGKMGPFVRLP